MGYRGEHRLDGSNPAAQSVSEIKDRPVHEQIRADRELLQAVAEFTRAVPSLVERPLEVQQLVELLDSSLQEVDAQFKA